MKNKDTWENICTLLKTRPNSCLKKKVTFQVNLISIEIFKTIYLGSSTFLVFSLHEGFNTVII